jgi:hypothetical protein
MRLAILIAPPMRRTGAFPGAVPIGTKAAQSRRYAMAQRPNSHTGTPARQPADQGPAERSGRSAGRRSSVGGNPVIACRPCHYQRSRETITPWPYLITPTRGFGATVASAPSVISLWFTEQVEPTFS